MDQKKYWNDVAEEKEFTTPFNSEEFCKYINKDSVILDVGCGYGRTLNELYLLEYKNLIGIDFSNNMIERGKKLYPYLDLREKKEDKIDFEDNSIDAVILFGVLTCIKDNDVQKKLIEEIRRVLKPDGILYINDFLLNTDERNMNRYKEFEEKYNIYGVFELPKGGIFRHHTEQWIKELLSEFCQLQYKKLVFTTMNGNKSNAFFYIGRK